ncbi:chloride channel protein [Aquabacter spiritensis]|uniref:CIC family chloride channel protein n=1 Tax=Aquabacter spiritensis TaxID=933073 RepID=A0A4R3LPS7_9HYPH|nr:chloride channel protein [Aquabacter spiritensis]TCT02402.1 CIC family chloride channel protein [Aquabacter spiritensis]
MQPEAREEVFEVAPREAGRAAIIRLLGRFTLRSEVRLMVLACLVGALAGTGATFMSIVAHAMHEVLFRTGPGGFLSIVPDLSSPYMYFIPAAGGLLLGLLGLLIKRYRPKPVIDPIEANALEGGRMSLTDSVILSSQTVLGNGFGASVGMEAGYTQWGSGVASAIGQKLGLNRADLRILVGCGAAGGIAAAFHAPLAGAFYAFELIIGVYAIPSVAPVMGAALLGYLCAGALGAVGTPIVIPHVPHIGPADYLPFILLGLVGALVAIAIMRLMTLIEQGFRRTGIPAALRPMVGGLAVGALAVLSPQVLSSGEAAIHIQVGTTVTLAVLGVLLLKILAAAFSLGSGFRGGLFSAALFMGVLLGKLFAAAAAFVAPALHVDPVISGVVGMAALAVGIVGGPVTMTFLVLEATSNLAITGLVLTAAIMSSLTVRLAFGYSFSTWRLHLRGESIRGAFDVGILRALTVGRLMTRDPPICPVAGRVGELRARFASAPPRVVVLVDGAGGYAGLVRLLTLQGVADDAPLADHLLCRDRVLHPGMRIEEAIRQFEGAGTPILTVVAEDGSGRVIGMLDEAEALHAYAQALEDQRRGIAGEEPVR